ncbi:MAG: family 16 glycosylhydrolase [Myxococcota bacterium]|nr:family 16 glycosylhydrolase [Myxococcota bacterium]
MIVRPTSGLFRVSFVLLSYLSVTGCDASSGATGGESPCEEGFVLLGDDCVSVSDDPGPGTDESGETEAGTDADEQSGDDTGSDTTEDTGDDDIDDSGDATAAEVTLPFAVDSYFSPSGYMGDGAVPGAVVETLVCPERAGDAQGQCHSFQYATGDIGWAGVYWQNPANNWGEQPGLPIAPGAQRVSFWAWAEEEVVVEFLVGGVGDEEAPYSDTFGVSREVTLGKTPQRYAVNLADVSYSKVVGGFGWSAEGPTDGSEVLMYIDDIQWQDDIVEQISGCTDGTATNPTQGATIDDGTCEYTLSFLLDASEVADQGLLVCGSWNDWETCIPLALNTEGFFEADLPVVGGVTYEYIFKYAPDLADDTTWVNEPLISGTACTLTTGEFINRVVTVENSSVQVGPICFGSCEPCGADLPEQIETTFQVALESSVNGVVLCGNWNGWWPCQDMLETDTGYAATVTLTEGVEYEYIYKTYQSLDEVGTWTMETLSATAPCVASYDGGANRVYVAPGVHDVLEPVCFGSCLACGETAVALDGKNMVTFALDTSEVGFDMTGRVPYLQGVLGWTTPVEMYDLDGDGIWTVQLELDENTAYQYKFSVGGVADSGSWDTWLDAESLAVGLSCTASEDEFTNRLLSTAEDDMELPAVCWQSCLACGETETGTGSSDEHDEPSDTNATYFEGFDGASVDGSRWMFDIGTGSGGWGNNEEQFYTSRSENVLVSDGMLRIIAREENYGGSAYTSAKLRSVATFTSGLIEARIKLPQGQGIWPAFWMMPVVNDWPSTGEIDIMELVGHEPATSHGTIHFGLETHAQNGGSYSLTSGIFADDFHVFAIRWTEDEIRWYVDGIYFHSVSRNSLGEDNWPFNDSPFYLILNLAVGGHWPGSPDSTTIFPQTMEVDWVRVSEIPSDVGCTDALADNFDATASTDDGSCQYAATFNVDMNCANVGNFGRVYVTGDFCNWCNGGYELFDDDGDGIYSGTFYFEPGVLSYKYMVDGWAHQEDLIDDMLTGDQCAPETDYANYANRRRQVGQDNTTVDVYGQCESCNP